MGDPSWLAHFGDVQRHTIENWGRLTSLRAGYASGLEVEFGLALPQWATEPDSGTERVVRDGMKVLWDPERILARLESSLRSD